MSEPYIGEIRLFAFDFAPRGWAICAGQLLPWAQNVALFSLFGTAYGGDGETTFALPDLRGRTPKGMGQGPGLSNYQLGQVGGTESVTLTTSQMPAHNHSAAVSNGAATSTRPSGKVPSAGGAYADASDGTAFNATHIANTGGSQPFANLPPYLGMNYCIVLEGTFPSRN